MRFRRILFVLCSLFPIPALASSSATPDTPEKVCSYITDQMRQAMPQNLTLCSGKPDVVSGYYEVNIFSPTNVLQGNLRRSWSSALFQILDSLQGACLKTKCIVSVSDSHMAQNHWRYRWIVDPTSLQNLSQVPQFSEQWYLVWWNMLSAGKESEITTTKESAMRTAGYACDAYLAAVRKIDDKLNLRPPTCSVMLATDRRIYLLIDFADFFSPAMMNHRAELPETIGHAFEDTGFDGQVIIRSPWDKGARVYWTYPIRSLSFANEEKESTTRTPSDMWELLEMFMTTGQIRKDALHDDPNHKFLLRTAAVVRYLRGTGHNVTVDTTDGAEWSVPQEVFDRCAISEGTELKISTATVSNHILTFDGPPTISVTASRGQCESEKVTFLGAW